LFWPVWWRK